MIIKNALKLKTTQKKNSFHKTVLKRGYTKKYSSQELIDMEELYSAHNYHPLPVVIDRSKGVTVWDPEGKKYFDFLSGYSALNQGHSHPKIVEALVEQANKCHLTSRAFYNSVYPLYAKYLCEYFGYESVLPMNTGAEAVDTALKIARKWGYVVKGIPEDKAHIISMTDSFHGRTFAAIALAKFDSNVHFGPDLSGFSQVQYNDLDALKEILERKGQKTCALIMEPIQGEAGVIVPDEGYLSAVSALCKEHNVLLINDEIQTGVARTGKLLAGDWENVKPDVLILGKAVSGGIYPVSAVLADNAVMTVIGPGDHGSTYGGNPLACAVAMAALQVVKDENLCERSQECGEIFRKTLREEIKKYPFVHEVRGKGLLNAMEMDPEYSKTAWDLCLILKENGLLAKPTHDNIIRFSPPLVITNKELDEALSIIAKSLKDFSS